MRIHFARIGVPGLPVLDTPAEELEAIAGLDRFGVHAAVDDPETADAIVFSQCHMLPSEWRLEPIREHPLSLRHRGRVMVYDERDIPWCAFAGIYVSMRASRFHWSAQRPWAYYRIPQASIPSRQPDLLFSFVGSGGPVCRRRIFNLEDRDAVISEVENFTFYDSTSPEFADKQARFREVLARSRFVLCPRGRGTSTFRLYETLAAGRVPVIISDDWVSPTGPAWDTFSIRCGEDRIHHVPHLIRERDDEWETMSRAAAEAHRDYFAPPAMFHRLAELWKELLDTGQVSTFPPRGLRDRAYLEAAVARTSGRMRLSNPRERARRLLRRWTRGVVRS